MPANIFESVKIANLLVLKLHNLAK